MTRYVYISAHHPDLANELADALTAAGMEVVSTWHRETNPRPNLNEGEAWRKMAARNFNQIDNADTLVLIGGPDKYTGGKFVEAGYALADGSNVFTVGRIENGMLYHPDVEHYETNADLVAALKGSPSVVGC